MLDVAERLREERAVVELPDPQARNLSRRERKALRGEVPALAPLREDREAPVRRDQLEPLRAKRRRPADVLVAPEQMVAGPAPHHDGHPFPVVLDGEAQRVPAGVGLAHVVAFLLELSESLELVRLPDWSYLEHGSSCLHVETRLSSHISPLLSMGGGKFNGYGL